MADFKDSQKIPKGRHAVVLLNMGGPDCLEAVAPFLKNLFNDHDIFKIPFGQSIFARLIARRRAPKVVERYRQIGGSSPINHWTATQAEMLRKLFQKEDEPVAVHVAMRYWHPLIKDTAAQLAQRDLAKIVLLPLYPHFSQTTTGSSFNEWRRRYDGDAGRLIFVDQYCRHPGYIKAVNQRIDEALLRFPAGVRGEVQLVFSAHGTPARLVKKGDPYSGQIRQTVQMVMAGRQPAQPHHLCFQSKVGPMAWLKPSTRQTLTDLARQAKKQILVVPISFVSDHIETLHELGIEYRAMALEAGIENYVVMTGLNDSALFVEALKDITLEAFKK